MMMMLLPLMILLATHKATLMTGSREGAGRDRAGQEPLLRLLFTFGQQKQRTRLYETKLKTNKKLHTKLKIMFSSYILLQAQRSPTGGRIVKNMKTHFRKKQNKN